MLARLPVEIILLICEYPEPKDLGQLAWTNKRMMQIFKKHLPIAFERRILFYLPYGGGNIRKGKIYLFDSYTNSVEQIANFHNFYALRLVATTQNKIFGINNEKKSFEIFDLNTRQTSRGPNPPEWREHASVAYFKDKLYYLGGREDPETYQDTNRVDVLIDGKWQTGPVFPLSISRAQAITCDGVLYVIDGWNKQIYRLSDDEREWIEVGELPEERYNFGAASLNGKIYITGGHNDGYNVLKSCLCFDPSVPINNRISRIADMDYARKDHLLIVANEKLYTIGECQKGFRNFGNLTEEYDSQTNKWQEVGKIYFHEMLFYLYYRAKKSEGRICLFNLFNCSVEGIANFHSFYAPRLVATTQNKIFGINNEKKSFEIFDLNTGQISRGPDPPKWRQWEFIAYYKNKLYYLGGKDPKTRKKANRVDVLIGGKWHTGPAFPLSVSSGQATKCDEILYVIDGWNSRKIYRLSDDEREWTEIGEIPEKRLSFGVASLNGKIYIIGGWNYGVLESCLCFDPSAPVDSRVSRIADMDYARKEHSLVVANEKLYAIGGYQKCLFENFCNTIEEYDPQTNKWRRGGKAI